MQYIQTMGYYLTRKMNCVLVHAAARMTLENTVLRTEASYEGPAWYNPGPLPFPQDANPQRQQEEAFQIWRKEKIGSNC